MGCGEGVSIFVLGVFLRGEYFLGFEFLESFRSICFWGLRVGGKFFGERSIFVFRVFG